MDNVEKYGSFINRIATAPDFLKVKLLQTSNLSIIKTISEIVYNILHFNIKVPKSTLSKLKKFKNVLHKLVNTKDLQTRKELLVKNPKCIEPLSVVFK